MSRFILIALALFLSACETASIAPVAVTYAPRIAQEEPTVNESPEPSPSPSPSVETRSCREGMRAIDEANCISNAPHSNGEDYNKNYAGALSRCQNETGALCSLVQMRMACQSGLIESHRTYWTRMVSGNPAYLTGSTVVIDSDDCSERTISIGRVGLSNPAMNSYYCCAEI